MRKTQKYVIVALHISDLEHVRTGEGAAAQELLIAYNALVDALHSDGGLYTPGLYDPGPVVLHSRLQ